MAFGSDGAERAENISPTNPVPAPAPAPAPAPVAVPEAAPQVTLQEDPGFKTLPRDVQIQVESGALSLADALASGATAAPAAPAPDAVAPTVDNTAPQAPTPGPLPSTQPVVDQSVSVGVGDTNLSAGTVLEGGRTGRDTFARPGTRGFQAFAGNDFNPFLLRNEARADHRGAAQSARDALSTDNIGRQVGGFSLEGQSPFLEDIISG